MIQLDTPPENAFRPSPLAPSQTPPTAAVIGPEGGILQVSDPTSPIRGTSLHIPPGALETHTFIQIEPGAHACSFGLAPSVKVTPEGLRFKHPVEIRIPISGSLKAPGTQVTCFSYSESEMDWLPWEDNPATAEDGVARCHLWHL
jgi:ZU5 domain